MMVLKNLFENYMEFEKIIHDKHGDKIDLGSLKLNPATVLPLLCECKNQNLMLSNNENAFDYLKNKLESDKLFSELPNSRIESDKVDFLTNYMGNLDTNYGSYFALRTIISELANNVYDHSKLDNNFVQSYIFSNLLSDYKKLDVCVIDDGLSFPGLFERENVGFKNDCQAIEKAVGTFSTISDSQFERGNGLWTVIQLVAEGKWGEILMVSRAGCLHISGENYKYYLLKKKHIFNGTLIAIRLNKYEIQNIYNLIEFNKPGSFKLGVIHDY